MKHISYAFTVCILAFAFAPSAYAAGCADLTRNLRVGMKGSDVLLLQRTLNSLPQTTIAANGPGSPGSETTYFGPLTKTAVIKFQELHRNEVLIPVGLTSGTGFVGTQTRMKLRSQCATAPGATVSQAVRPPYVPAPQFTPPKPGTILKIPPAVDAPVKIAALARLAEEPAVTSPQTDTLPLAPSNDNLYISQPGSYAVAPGETFFLLGGGFDATNNTVTIGAMKFTGVKKGEDGTLSVVIPLTMPKGKFDVTVTSSRGTSNKSFVVVTALGAVPPMITNVTPETGVLGGPVTITGENLSKEWNDIYVGGAVIAGLVSSDGKTLNTSFPLDIPGVTMGQDTPGVDVELPVWFSIVNPNGVSNSMLYTAKI